MIAILYPLKMTKNLYEAYSSIYEVSADLAIRAAKAAEKKRAESAKAGDTEGAKKAMRQNKKFFDYAKDKRQKENMPKKPTGPMVNKPMPDPRSSYPGTPQIMKAGKKVADTGKADVKAGYEPEGDMVEGYMSDDKKDHNTGGFRISQREADEARKRVMKKTAIKMTRNKKRGMGTLNTNKTQQMASYQPEGEMIDEMRYNDGKSKERLEALSKKRGIPMKKMKKHPQFQPEGKFRREWEALKLIETENYREQFDTWLDGILEEGYDIDRWSDEELVDTFINENNLWASREAVDSALLESDKKGKGSGKKDACYHKVKASASVWPSAYASGRLVQCRKKGAANYGNSKKEDFSDWRSDLQVITEKDAPYGEGAKEAKQKGASSETRGKRIYNRARELAQDRYRRKSSGVGQNERAGYNLSRTLQGGNRNKELRTQGGPQTGGNQSVPHSLGGFVTPRAQRKSLSGTKDTPGKGNPIKKKSPIGDTGSHQKKADTKRTTTKSGKKLKKPTYKYKPEQRANIGDEGRSRRKDPKKNPLHQKNTGVVKNPKKQERKEKVKQKMIKSDFDLVSAYNSVYHEEL